MFATIASFLGKSLLRGITDEILADAASATMRQALTEEVTKQLEEPKPQVQGVDSETWYAFRMSKEAAWEEANRYLADELTSRIPRAYADYNNRMPPFIVSADYDVHNIFLTFNKVPRTNGFNRTEAKSATINAVRSSLREYIRAAATNTWMSD